MASREVIGEDREFHITILGRLLEHLGTQMYKQRAVAIAELVANSWDAGAENVYIELPPVKDFDRFVSKLAVTDDGVGMNPDHIDEQYLVIGRNRRKAGENYAGDRPVMGRKGIGKLAGFGIASEMTVLTWRDERATEFTLNINDLKKDAGIVGEVPIAGTVGTIPDSFGHRTGTKIILRTLKHKTPLDPHKLQIALARRFSRRTRGGMKIFVNGELVGDPQIELEERHPKENYESATLSDGSEITYYYGFAKETIKERELRGFTIYARGKTAQAPPFFFDAEATAWGQHGTKYLTGEVNADFLDDGIDDESDLIATDRQQIDWEDDRTHPLNDWGRSLTNKILRERSTRKGKEMEKEILAVADFSARINRLDPPSQKQIRALLRTVGESEPDPERKHSLADSLVKAFEYRHFHDVVQEIESVSDNPEGLQQLLTQLYQWKVLESRAILEVVRVV